jgi:glucuronate isomerase
MSILKRLYTEVSKIPIVDIHTHVDFKNPTAVNARDILGYHYFTEMAHSQGMSVKSVEQAKEISRYLPGAVTTEPYNWLMFLAKKLFDFPHGQLDENTCSDFEKCIEKKAKNSNRLQEICEISNIEIISTTNAPWENLDGIEKYKNEKGEQLFIPTFRIDPLLTADRNTVGKLEESTDKEISNLKKYKQAIIDRFSYFKEKGSKSLAVSLYTDPLTLHVDEKVAEKIFLKILKRKSLNFSEELLQFHAYMLDFLSGLCAEHNFPFQLMVGVERDVYNKGVPGGTDIFQPNGSLLGLKYLLNKYPNVKFPISVLSSNQDKELAVYARIFPNVYASGHWWFENTYESIELTLKNRLKIAPYTKLIGQYSDAYTTELIEAKLDMYRRVLSKVLAEYTEEKRIDEKEALNIAKNLLYNGLKKVFGL